MIKVLDQVVDQIRIAKADLRELSGSIVEMNTHDRL
jgi:hypothetical protein